jgi:uncharacterized membrane protein YphA (DoxX/SURF4 family)
MRSVIDNDYATLFSRLLIGGLYIYAAWYKIVVPAEFAKAIWFYHLVPGNLINVMALILPWLEMLLGVGLILGIWFRGSAFSGTALMLVFIAALTSAVMRNLSIDCGCFKSTAAGANSARETLYRDLALLIPCLQLLFTKSRRWMLCPGSRKESPAATVSPASA